MSRVLSLIGPGSKGGLTQDDVDAARFALDQAGLRYSAPDWLSPGEACELLVADAEPLVVGAVRLALASRAIDVNLLPAGHRRKRLLLADMDSTLIEQECIDELAAEIGRGPEVAAITERAMRGEIAFEPALRDRVALLRGLPTELAVKVLRERVSIMPGAATLVSTMRSHGAHTVLVSGGFTIFAEPVAKAIGFDESHANALVTEGSLFAGRVEEPILGRAAKEATLLKLADRLGIDTAETLAVGDGANDIGMIRRAGLGVAYRGKPALRAEADAAIEHSDLTALLFLQGYRKEEFAIPSATTPELGATTASRSATTRT